MLNEELFKERLAAFVARVEADPACWNQSKWHCGSAHCCAGWAQLDMGLRANDNTARRDGRIWYGLTSAEADYLFAPARTLDDFRSILTDGFYDRDGYSRAGYDRDGYSRAGYDCDGLKLIDGVLRTKEWK